MTKSWWQMMIYCVPALEEVIFEQLQSLNCVGTASELKNETLQIKAYFPSPQVQSADLEQVSIKLQQQLQGFEYPFPRIEWKLIEEQDWSNQWMEDWQYQEIGKQFITVPIWLPIPEDSQRLILKIDPGMAFGTGLHPTTQLCIQALEEQLAVDTSAIVADIGCGSGILAIAALKLGANLAYAVDTDPLAIDSTLSHAQLNQIDLNRLMIAEGSLEKLQEIIQAPVDGIICNILAEVIIQLLPNLATIATPKAWAILSGIALEQADLVQQAIQQSSWQIKQFQKQEKWCCFSIQRMIN